MKTPKHKIFLCRYYHKGSWWSMEITADDIEDAEARVAKLGNLQLQGELMMSIDAGAPGAGVLVRFVTWAMNLLKNRRQ